MADQVSEDIHPIFKRDPEEWKQNVYKQVNIRTEDGMDHVGWVYTIDPVSETYVLVRFSEEKTDMEIILGHAVQSVSVLNDNTEAHRLELDRLFKSSSSTNLSEEGLKERQLLLKSWLEKNRLPVQVSGSDGELLMIADALTIQPPYGADNCISTNEIILGRIQGLIKNMPLDQGQW